MKTSEMAFGVTRLLGTDTDIRAVHDVLADSPAYSMAVTGASSSAKDASAVFESIPPQIPSEDKHVLAFQLGSITIGIADVIRGYPSPGTAHIGLLLIRERWQRRGSGYRSFEHIRQMARNWGCGTLRIAIVEANRAVIGFWSRCGFEDTGCRVPYHAGSVASQSMIYQMPA